MEHKNTRRYFFCAAQLTVHTHSAILYPVVTVTLDTDRMPSRRGLEEMAKNNSDVRGHIADVTLVSLTEMTKEDFDTFSETDNILT